MNHCLIIEAGHTPDSLIDKHGNYADMIERWLSPFAPDTVFTRNRRYNDEPLPPPDAQDAVVISGSRFGVYEEAPWMVELECFIRALFRAKIPIFGICFGHQIIAKAMGGSVEMSDRGWGLGTKEYRLAPNTYEFSGPLCAHAVHQDQIVKLPDNATVLGGNGHCPFAILGCDQAPVASVQFHPEFTQSYLTDLLPVLAERGVQPEILSAAKASLTSKCNDKTVARWAAAILFNTNGARPQ
jgi:GMP synthase-like glutamine amidotransferase